MPNPRHITTSILKNLSIEKIGEQITDRRKQLEDEHRQEVDRLANEWHRMVRTAPSTTNLELAEQIAVALEQVDGTNSLPWWALADMVCELFFKAFAAGTFISPRWTTLTAAVLNVKGIADLSRVLRPFSPPEIVTAINAAADVEGDILATAIACAFLIRAAIKDGTAKSSAQETLQPTEFASVSGLSKSAVTKRIKDSLPMTVAAAREEKAKGRSATNRTNAKAKAESDETVQRKMDAAARK